MKSFLIILSLFIFSISIRLWNLNAMGRTWDEQFYTQEGYRIINLIKNKDFSNAFWIENPDEPIFSKYFYGLGALFDYKGKDIHGNLIFDYNLFHTRLVSVIFGSFSVVLLVLFALRYFSLFTSVAGGILFSIFPTYIALTQRVTIESILVFFYIASFFVFILFLEKPSYKKVYSLGTLLGISCIIKYSNVIIFLLFLIVFNIYGKSKQIKYILSRKFFYLFWFFLGFLQLIIIWPMPWLNISKIVLFEYKFRFSNGQSPWEWFFGFPIHVPWIYYIVHFLIRTPVIFLFLGFWGIWIVCRPSLVKIKINKKIYYAILAWFLLPFIQSFYHFRMHGVRYIIQVYAPFSILAAIGLERIIQLISCHPGRSVATDRILLKFHGILSLNKVSLQNDKLFKRVLGTLISLGLAIYFFFIFRNIQPYYLDYFNELIGGTKTVYRYNLFELGWWGEGGREAGEYIISHAKNNAKIGYKLNPFSSLLQSNKLQYFIFNKKEKYDYVVINYYEYQKVGYNNVDSLADYSFIKHYYNHVYTVYAYGAELYNIYKVR